MQRYLTGVIVVTPNSLQVSDGLPGGIANQVHINSRMAKLYSPSALGGQFGQYIIHTVAHLVNARRFMDWPKWIPTSAAEDLSAFATVISVELYRQALVNKGGIRGNHELCVCDSVLSEDLQQEALRI